VKYQGLDIAPEFAAPHILVHDITAGLPFPDSSFDNVFMIEVLEHTPTAYETAGEIHRVLKREGCGSCRSPTRTISRTHLESVSRGDKQGHIYSWTRQTITRLEK